MNDEMLVRVLFALLIILPTNNAVFANDLVKGLLGAIIQEGARSIERKRRNNGRQPLKRSPSRVDPLADYKRYYADKSLTADLQANLNKLGHAAGKVDGAFGQKTLNAVRRWQVGAGFTPSGYISRDQLVALNREVRVKESQRDDLYIITQEQMNENGSRYVQLKCSSGGYRSLFASGGYAWSSQKSSQVGHFHDVATRACQS